MAQVYTRTGDKGTTALFGGSRVPKQSIRVSAYGSVDEANAFIGAAKTVMADDELRDFVHQVGHRLFVLGSELASDVDGRARLIGLVNDTDITQMEALVDKCMAFCGPQRAFVVPGTEPVSAALHIARTAVRRAERMVLTLAETEDVRPEAIKYLNRLSDALYAIARVYEVRHEFAMIEAQVRAKVAAGVAGGAHANTPPTHSGMPGSGGVSAQLSAEGTLVVGAQSGNPTGPLGAVCAAPNWDKPAEGCPATPSPADQPSLDLARCRLAADTATRLARAQGLAITFAAVDASGVPIMVQRDDNAIFVSVQVAQDKAFTAASVRMPTADLAPLVADGGDFQGLSHTHGGRITALGGGLPVFLNGRFVGGIGVSGASGEQDIMLVTKALEAIGGTCA